MDSIQYLGGDDTRYPWDTGTSKVKKLESAQDLISRIVDSFNEKPIDQVSIAKAAMDKIDKLSIQEIPKPDFNLSYEQILDIQRTLSLEIKRLYQQEEEEFLFLVYHII